MIVPADKRVSEISGVGPFKLGGRYVTADPGGPAGSSLMTFFCVATLLRIPSGLPATQYFFSRNGGTTAGWYLQSAGNTLRAVVANGTPAYVVSPTLTIVPSLLGIPLVLTATYNAGTLTFFVNKTNVGATSLGAGFTSAATRTAVGTPGNTTTDNARDALIHECGMLNGVDLSASISSVVGQWQEDLQQGRHLTWPRAMTVNDWYWSARDIAAPGVGASTWTDRGPNAVAMTRSGVPESVSIPARFAQ